MVQFTPDACATLRPRSSRLAEALNTLAAAALGTAHAMALHDTPLWRIMAMIAGGHLLLAPRGS
ncbi:hypothetical protein J5X84_43525 [Streptosporangiaceae bacterium NEAU-GS5]|nr:hypothetical protein [Streptosporangiaceae bacterium NEAU-GS5]